MRADHLVNKMIFEHKEQVKFLEEYYTEKNGFPTHIKFINSDTSYYANPNIYISRYNLEMFLNYDEVLMRPLFYTLLMHEMGHAIYTQGLPYSMVANVVEDNRIEYQISQWNVRANFKLMRYVFQDKQVATMSADRILNDKQVLALALLRTIDNRKYYNLLCYTKQRKDIVNAILALHDEYMKLDYKYYTATLQERLHMETLITEIDALIDLLLELQAEENQKPDQPEPSDEPTDDESTDDTTDTPSQPNKLEQELEQVMQDLTDLKQEAMKMKSDVDYDTPILYNDLIDNDPYRKYKISAFDTQRRNGIKGASNIQSTSGNAKQLNMQRYMRRNIVSGEKLFDKPNGMGRGGQSVRAAFFIDISGSMSGPYIKVATDYLKSFYDTMHNHMEIRLFGFGSTTFKITRNELNLNYIENNLQGSTRINKVKLLPNEQMIVITDGQINFGPKTESIRQNAHFVIIDEQDDLADMYAGYNKKTFVRMNNIAQGIDQATQHIRKLLQER